MNLKKLRVKWFFIRSLRNFRKVYCFNQNNNSSCSSEDHANIHMKYRWEWWTFKRKSSQCSEKSLENSLYKQCPKTDINILLYMYFKIQTYRVHQLSWDFISMLTVWCKWSRKHGNHCLYPCIRRSIVSYSWAIMPSVSNYSHTWIESL